MRQWALRSTFTSRYFRRVILLNLLAASAAVLFMAWFGQITNSGAFWETVVHGLVYAYVMGTLGATILPIVAVRVKDRPVWFRLTAVGAGIVFMTVVGSALAGAVLILIGAATRADIVRNYPWVVKFSLVIAFTAGFGMYLFEMIRSRLERTTIELRERQLAEERAMKLAAEARLSSLESRIHPHFLFNTLNSIAELIHEDPNRAEETVGRLAALLRFSLDVNRQPLVPVSQELKTVRDYLEIEKVRLGERLRYTIEAGPEVQDVSVPPLAIELLVENSIKHVIAPARGGGELRVTIRRDGAGRVAVRVADTGPGFDLALAPPGHGIDTLQARLAALYAGAARLETSRVDGWSVVELSVPEAAP